MATMPNYLTCNALQILGCHAANTCQISPRKCSQDSTITEKVLNASFSERQNHFGWVTRMIDCMVPVHISSFITTENGCRVISPESIYHSITSITIQTLQLMVLAIHTTCHSHGITPEKMPNFSLWNKKT